MICLPCGKRTCEENILKSSNLQNLERIELNLLTVSYPQEPWSNNNSTKVHKQLVLTKLES